MIIPNIWENKKCSKPPTSKKMDHREYVDDTSVHSEAIGAYLQETFSVADYIPNSQFLLKYPNLGFQSILSSDSFWMLPNYDMVGKLLVAPWLPIEKGTWIAQSLPITPSQPHLITSNHI